MTKSVARKVFLPIVVVIWLFGIGVGLRFVLAYENSPGVVRGVVHPHCPCSRASVSELSLLLSQVQGRVNANVLFVRPLGVPDNWEIAELWAHVARVPGVKLNADNDGVEARRFGSATSGQVMLYSTQGELLFSGGITASRGHSGENSGRSAIVALLTQGQAATHETPVFGCPLFVTATDQEELCDASHKN